MDVVVEQHHLSRLVHLWMNDDETSSLPLKNHESGRRRDWNILRSVHLVENNLLLITNLSA
jgi:hypothetical protein